VSNQIGYKIRGGQQATHIIGTKSVEYVYQRKIMAKYKSIFVSNEQQIEGLKFTSKLVSMREFSRSTATLVREGFMRRSERHKLIKKMRHIKGISWEEYKKEHEVKINSPTWRIP